MDRAHDGVQVEVSADDRTPERRARDEVWSDEEPTSLEPFQPMRELMAGDPPR